MSKRARVIHLIFKSSNKKHTFSAGDKSIKNKETKQKSKQYALSARIILFNLKHAFSAVETAIKVKVSNEKIIRLSALDLFSLV